jgi:hypothetical protein
MCLKLSPWAVSVVVKTKEVNKLMILEIYAKEGQFGVLGKQEKVWKFCHHQASEFQSQFQVGS